ncbi:MAG: hypothetical protein IKC32_07455 [Clostridia bacterium]|nr:hypothetical protein [Clostridia bacterium]
MNKYEKTNVSALPDAAELRRALAATESSSVREQIALLFDANTFVETAAYMKRSISDFISTDKGNEFEGVITGYGAIDGKLVFAFAEDAERMGGAIDERHAKKIADLYKLAMDNGAPVIGIFNSNGTDVFAGTTGLAAYGRILSVVNAASGVIPQIALVAGNCIGTCAAIAATFDFVIKESGASLYVSSPALTHNDSAQDSLVSFSGSIAECAGYARFLVSFLPDNASTGVQVVDCADNLNRLLGELNFAGEGLSAISAIVDNGVLHEVGADFAKAAHTAFATIGGVKCGIIANSSSVNNGKLCTKCAKKIARFVNLCDSFSIPVVTLVDSMGVTIDKDNECGFASALARLATAYASATCPKVTVIIGKAIGASFVLLGSKSIGADVVYAVDSAEIGALSADSGVAFAWDKYITEEKSRQDFVNEWRVNVSSPAHAAASGEIDDIISVTELRARICSALLMLASKGCSHGAKRKVLPL